jgi:hypothetical protein
MTTPRLPCDRRSDEDRLADLNADLSDGMDIADVVWSFVAGLATLAVLASLACVAAALWGRP